jgi:phosphoesterase RecJ-like protein
MIAASLLKDAWVALDAAGSIVLACHQRPDGDTLGSALAVAHALRARGKDVVVLSEDGVPENYVFIPESDTIAAATDRRDFDIGMLVDCEGIERAGTAADAVTSAKTTGCVDHHVPDGEFGGIRVVDTSASSTAEVVVDLLDANVVEIDQVCATQLLTGLIADTGAFRFANTSPRTFHTAARLTDLGADPSAIAREVYDTRPLHAMRLLGRALCSVETTADGRVAWAVITKSDLDELGATDADTDSIINYVRMARGASVAILLREVEPHSIRISLRSRDGIDVNQVARAFGGGGHVAAAGCTIDAPLEEARRRMLDEVRRWMES